MISAIQQLGAKTTAVISGLGRAVIMLLSALSHWPNVRKGTPLLLQQLYTVGVLSLVIILVSGLFIGMVLALQGYTILVGYGAEASLGPMVALSLLRELGPSSRSIVICWPRWFCTYCRNWFDESD